MGKNSGQGSRAIEATRNAAHDIVDAVNCCASDETVSVGKIQYHIDEYKTE